MDDLLAPAHLILLAVVALVFFGPQRLPELGSGIGRAIAAYRRGLRGEEPPAPPTAPPAPQDARAAPAAHEGPHDAAAGDPTGPSGGSPRR